MAVTKSAQTFRVLRHLMKTVQVAIVHAWLDACGGELERPKRRAFRGCLVLETHAHLTRVLLLRIPLDASHSTAPPRPEHS